MPKQNRVKTTYPGVYYIQTISKATGKPERIFYITYRKDGKQIEEKAGRQFQDDMTAAKASRIRALRIERKQLSNIERRIVKDNLRLTKNIWTIDMISTFRKRKKDSKVSKLIHTDITNIFHIYLET